MLQLQDYLDHDLICFIHPSTREEAITSLVDAANRLGKLNDRDHFLNAVTAREAIVTTGIGMGVAVPHAKCEEIKEFFMVIGVLEEGVDWSSLDAAPVRLVFLIGGPDDRQEEYLGILSHLTSVLRQEKRRKQLIEATSAEEVVELLSQVPIPPTKQK